MAREKLDLQRLLNEDVEEVPDNVPLHTLQKNIDESLDYLREKLKKRREEIEKLLNEQKDLCNGKSCQLLSVNAFFSNLLFLDLEEPERPLPKDPLPSEQDMQGFRDHLEQLRNEQFARFDRMMELRSEIKEVMAKLEISVLNEYDNKFLSCVEMKPTLRNLEKMDQIYENLRIQFEKMKHQIEDMRKRLSQLWKFLEISENHQRKFVKYTDYNQTTYLKLLAEVQHCEQNKKENIRKFIEKVRVEIETYWDICLKSDTERLRFPSYTANVFNEDVLELHEDELRDLKSFYENNEAIFNIIRERQDLWNQMESLQNKESDPKRYNNRGGQLLKEEKERKMVAMKMPKIEAKLIELVEKFESAHNRPFTMFGVPIQDIIERDYEAKRQEKLTKSGKKIIATPARTPGRSNMTSRTPLTIEQTIINRTTAMKTTGGRLRIATQSRMINTTASSTASSVRSVRTENGKRRLAPPKMNGPQAKRQLLGAFASPSNANVLRQVNGNGTGALRKLAPAKNTSLKVYNVGSCIKRRSRKSGGKKRRSSMMKKLPMPTIRVNSSGDATINERETTSYEGFEVSCLNLVGHEMFL